MTLYIFLASGSLLVVLVRKAIMSYINITKNRNNNTVEIAGKLSKEQISKSGNRLCYEELHGV